MLALTVVRAASLQNDIEQIARGHAGGLTLYAEDTTSHATVSIDPDRKVPTASVIKLAVLFEALEQLRAGKVKWDDPLTLLKLNQVPGSGVLLFFSTPENITFRDAVTMMIVMSDNTACNLVIDHLGFAAINRRIESLGLKDTYLYNKVFAHEAQPLPPAREEDHKRFGLGSTTAREMTAVMKRIYDCDLGGQVGEADRQLCSAALTVLGNQFYRDCIPRYLDGWDAPGSGTGTAVGNKTGSLDAVRNDVAAVAGKNGAIFISVFTFDNKDQSWTVDNQAEITIAKIARRIAGAWSPEGLAPNRYNTRP